LGKSAGSALPRSYFAAGRPATAPRAAAPPSLLPAVDPAGLALYLLTREDDARSDAALGERYLRQPELLARATKLRDAALDNWLAGRPPWNLAEFHACAMRLADGQTGAALLLCHNVAASFARGGQAIRWIKTDRLRGEYFDGARSFTARALHRNGVLSAGPFAAPSLFYLIFSAAVFGTVDPGDWRRYFGSAALAWYLAANAISADTPITPFAKEWATALDGSAREWAVSTTPAAQAWAYANAASFHELARYGRSAEANRRASRVQLAGVRFGCEQTSLAPLSVARWRIPLTNGAVELLDSAGNLLDTTPADASATAAPHSIRESVLKAMLRVLPRPPLQSICTVEEGVACRLATSGWHDSPLQPLAETVASEIGWNVLDHAVRRQAALRLTDAAAPELDLGEGYRPCRVVSGS
jgi:hypothetical protein